MGKCNGWFGDFFFLLEEFCEIVDIGEWFVGWLSLRVLIIFEGVKMVEFDGVWIGLDGCEDWLYILLICDLLVREMLGCDIIGWDELGSSIFLFE